MSINVPNLKNLPDANVSVTISSGGSTSNEATLQGKRIAAIIMPAAFTGANLTFQASIDGSTWYDIYNSSGSQVTCTVGTDQWIAISPQDFAGVSRLKVVSDDTEAAERTITLVVREYV